MATLANAQKNSRSAIQIQNIFCIGSISSIETMESIESLESMESIESIGSVTTYNIRILQVWFYKSLSL